MQLADPIDETVKMDLQMHYEFFTERERERERERDGREEFEKWKCMMMKKENLYMWVKCRASCAASNGGKSRVKSGVKDDCDPYILNPNGSFTGLSR